jgi:NADH dehydrogenase
MAKRQQKKEQTKERIISEALELFKSQGFKQTSVDSITLKAQVAKGTFFNYFSTKEALLIELQNQNINSAFSFIHSSHVQTLPFLTQMEHLLNYLLSYFDVDPIVTRQAFLAHHTGYNQDGKEEEIDIVELFFIVIDRGQIRGEIREDIESTLLAECCYGLFISSLYSLKHMSQKKDLIEDISKKIVISFEGFSNQKGRNQMKRNVVILGGGYGGLRIIQRLLASSLPSDIQLTLIDRMPYHSLKTEYYALAAGTEPDSALRVSFPNDPRLLIKYGEISRIDPEQRQIYIEGEEVVPYDYLVIGLGCEDKYHGVPGAQEHTYSIQTMNKTRETFRALNNVKPYGKVTIVGGGLSGVELASELRESRPDLNIQIYDRGESILNPFPERLKKYVRTWFINHGIDLIHKANITKVEHNLLYNNDQAIETDAIVWTAGIQANKIVQKLPVEQDQMGRVLLSEHHYIPEYPEIFVVGDCASLAHAPSAQLAEAQGDQIALVLQATFHKEPLPTLPRFKLKGVLGSLGKKHGFGLMGETTLLGRVPRVLKTGVLWMYKNHLG